MHDWECLYTYKAHQLPVWTVKFAPLGYYFASGSADKLVKLWSVQDVPLLRILVGHILDVTAL